MMRSIKSLIFVSLSISMLLAQPEDFEQEEQAQQQQQQQPQVPVSKFKARGSLNSQVHLLSQMSEPHPDVKLSIVFPLYFGKVSEKSLLEMGFVQGVNEKVLVGIQNNGDEPIQIKNITGSFVEEGLLGEKPKYIQNLTIESFDGAIVHPTDTFSIAYEFFAFTSIPAKNYKLILAVFYSDSQFEYASYAFNSHVQVIESDQSVGITGLFSMLLTAGVIFLISFVVYVKVQDRYFGAQDGRKRKQTGGFLGTLRDLISQ